MDVNIAKWVCEKCYNIMEVYEVEENYNEIYCPVCGNRYYVDDEGEYIGE